MLFTFWLSHFSSYGRCCHCRQEESLHAAGQHLEHRTVIRISIIRLCNEEDRLQHWKVIYWNLLKGRPGLITDGCLQQKLPGAEREVLHSVTRERENITHYIRQKYSNFVLDMNFISVVFVQLSEPVRKNHLDSIQDRTHLSLPLEWRVVTNKEGSHQKFYYSYTGCGSLLRAVRKLWGKPWTFPRKQEPSY